MKAAWFSTFGPANEVLKIGEQPTPSPESGEVLVRLSRSAVNPSDVKKRAGSFPNLLDQGLVIPNSDGSGVIEAVGGGVDSARIGERVWVYQAQFQRRFGTAAQYLTIDACRAVKLPEQTSDSEDAYLGIPAMTAHRCVFADGDIRGQKVLVTGGAGRVGHYAIQLAALQGAQVIATASNATDRKACIEAGAHAVVNHRDANWAEEVLESCSGPVDRVIDVEFGANLPEVLKLISVGGVIATYSSTQLTEPKLPFFQMMYQDLTVRLIIVYAMPEPAKTEAIAAITQLLGQGILKHRIATELPLNEISAANELVESGKCRGSVLLTVD